MSSELILEEVDVFELPTLDVNHIGDEGAQITMGDLHGNFIKLLFLLIKHGIATDLSEQSYLELVSIYKIATELYTHAHLKQFNCILTKIKFHAGAIIRLIGDELSDRGKNDYFTLKLLEKLHEHNVKVEILLSNHSSEFIDSYEKRKDFHPLLLNKDEHALSMENMQKLIDKGLLSKNEIYELANSCYKPSLKAISYTLNEDQTEITIYSHAAIGLNTIDCIAKKLGLSYNDKTATALAQTIDAIHVKFHEYVQTNTVHCLYTRAEMIKGYQGYLDLNPSPFEFLMWNRRYDNIERPIIKNGYGVNFVHGHDTQDQSQNNIYNLDNYLGKALRLNKGQYAVLYSHESSLL